MLTMTDFYCGAGGSSSGAIQVPGVEVKVASNHWNLAIATHNENHQQTEHICADLSQITPALFPRTDIGWFSPECTNHSQAKGVALAAQREGDETWEMGISRDAAERSRATMWDVVRFTEHHRYKAVIVENVTEVYKWVLYKAWESAMRALGYRLEIVCLNSMHASAYGDPAAQSRDRVYFVFTLIGNPAPRVMEHITPWAKCGPCDQLVQSVQRFKKPGNVVGRYRQQYLYHCPTCSAVVEPAWLPASTIIDWSLPGQRIGDRKKALADKTRARIAAGIARYWGPMTLEAAGNTYDAADPKHVSHGQPGAYYRIKPVTAPLDVVHTTLSKGLAVPVEGRTGKSASPVSEPLRTQTARNETGLAFVAHLKGSAPSQVAGAHSPVDEPLHTVAASGNHHALVTSYYGTSAEAKPAEEPVGTITTTDRHGLVLSNNHGNVPKPVTEPAPTVTTATTRALLTPAGGTWDDKARPDTEPVPTLTTRDSRGLVMRNNTGGAEMVTPTTEPVRTITTAGHQSLITAADMEAARQMVDDVYFRMFEPDECKRAMAFEPSYVLLGNKREQVRMAGNAVTPPSARDIIAVVAISLGVIA